MSPRIWRATAGAERSSSVRDDAQASSQAQACLETHTEGPSLVAGDFPDSGKLPLGMTDRDSQDVRGGDSGIRDPGESERLSKLS